MGRVSLRAGVAEIDITPSPGVDLMGYGARQGAATGVHDPILARALSLGSDTGQALLVCADLCLMAPTQARELRERIFDRSGISPENIMISCSHTHSGPDTGLAARLSGQPEPAHVTAIFERLVDVACEAAAQTVPCRLTAAEGEVRIGRNRRLENGPLDPALLIVQVEREADGRPLAVVFQHACHGTVLGHDNLEFSADWAGVAARRLREATGAPALFLLGAHADIDPRTRGLMDLAIPGQSLGLGFEAVRILGEEAAAAALEALGRAEPAEPSVSTQCASIELPLQLGDLDPADARKLLEERKAALGERLGTDLENFPRLSGLGAAAFERARALPLDQARELLSATRLYLRDKSAPFFTGGERRVPVEVQVMRIGDAIFLGLPVEPTTNVGLDWKRRMRGRFRHAGLVGIANGWLRYLPHADDLAHPQAHLHYEVLESILAPGACERLLDEAERLTEAL